MIGLVPQFAGAGHSPGPAPTHGLLTDEEAHQLAIIVVILDAFALVLVSALAEHVGQDQSAQTPPALAPPTRT